jgi:hypothetical protein
VSGDRGRDRQSRHAEHLAVGNLIAPTARTRLARRKERGTYDREVVNAILDVARSCHVGFSVDGLPLVVPTVHARDSERLPAVVAVPAAVAACSRGGTVA